MTSHRPRHNSTTGSVSVSFSGRGVILKIRIQKVSNKISSLHYFLCRHDSNYVPSLADPWARVNPKSDMDARVFLPGGLIE